MDKKEQRKHAKFMPGYTGHIPAKEEEPYIQTRLRLEGGYIPNYAGYVPKIKPENIYGKTFGVITENVCKNKLQGYDPLLTTTQIAHVEYALTKIKKVADCVGVQHNLHGYRQPTDDEIKELSATVSRIEPDQAYQACSSFNKKNQQEHFVDKENESPAQLYKNDSADVFLPQSLNSPKLNDKLDDEKKEQLKKDVKTFIENSIPGYTGHRQGVYAENIHGQSFKNSEDIAKFIIQKMKENDEDTLSKYIKRSRPLENTL